MDTCHELSNADLCNDFSQFMEKLKEHRVIDDRIIYKLNTTIPTQSFSSNVDVASECKTLYDMIVKGHESRVEAIKNCISIQATKTKNLISQKEKDPDNYKILKNLRKEQGSLRLYQQELNIEEIIQERAQDTFYDKCRNYYKP